MSLFYSYEIQAPIINQVEDNFNIDSTQFNLGYSFYSFPNIFVPFFGGLLIDKPGNIITVLYIATFLMVVGQTISWAATGPVTISNIKPYDLYLAGRVVFGSGGTIQIMCMQKLLGIWFGGYAKISLAFSVFWSLALVGRGLNQLITPAVYDHYGEISASYLTGLGIAILSFISVITISILHRHDRKIELKREAREKSNQDRSSGPQDVSINQTQDDRKDADGQVVSQPKKKKLISFRDLKKLNKMYALIVIFSIFSDETTWVFLGNANKIFTTRYGVTKTQVSTILSVQLFFA